MNNGDQTSGNTPTNHDPNQLSGLLPSSSTASNSGFHRDEINANNNNTTDNHNNASHSHHQGANRNGNAQDFGLSPQNYFDTNWASSLLMDSNNDILYNMDLSSNANIPSTNSVMYQGNAPPGNANVDGKSESQPLQPKANIQQQDERNLGHQPIKPNSSVQQQQLHHLQQQSRNTKPRRPCDHCRRRKTKCVIIPNTNNCAQCESKSLTCTYVGLVMKRKAGYESDSDSKRLKNDDKDSDSKSNSDYSNNPSLGVQNDHSNIVPPNVPIRNVDPVRDYSAINNSLLQKTLSLQFPRSSFYVGPTSYLYDINLLNLIIDSQNNANNSGNSNSGKIEQVNLSNSISLRKVSDNVQFVLKDDQTPQSFQNMSNDVDTIEKFVAPHGQILIDLYFRIIHPSYPILHKKVFLEKYSRTHREFNAALLAAVYVLAIQWWDYDPQLNKFPKPKVELILKIGLNNYLLEILKRPKLSAVQAGLLLLQCKHLINSNDENISKNSGSSSTPIGDSNYSDWVLCSQVITLAEELGLGLDCNNWKLPKWERGLRKRLAWAVYTEDKWLSLKNARPSHINEINWIVVKLVDEDFPEKHGDGDLEEGSSDIDNGKKIFTNLINLTMILSKILDQLYSMRAMAEIKDVGQVLQIAKPLQLELRNWYHSLPTDLQMSSVQPRKLCSNGYLQLAYFATELTLHRKIITTIYQQSLVGNPPPKELVDVCRSAAKTRLSASIDFARDLKPEHMHSFWHSSSASNFTLIGTFAAILYMTSVSKEESDFYKDQIFNYRWILKISSKGFEQVSDVLLELDLVLNHIPGLLNENTNLPMMGSNSVDLNHLQLIQEQQLRPSNNSQSSFRQDSPSFTNYNKQSPTSMHINNQDSNKNSPNNNRMRIGPHQQRLHIQKSDSSPYLSPRTFATPSHSNHNQGQPHLAKKPQPTTALKQDVELSPKSAIKKQIPANVGSRDIADINSPTLNQIESNLETKDDNTAADSLSVAVENETPANQ